VDSLCPDLRRKHVSGRTGVSSCSICWFPRPSSGV
jgi:hypothetical protein